MNSYFYLSKILSPFLSIINILFLFLIINIILYFFFKKKIIKNLILISFIVIFIIGFFPVGSFFLKSIEKKYYEQIKLEDVDAIAVLAGDINITQTSKFNKIHFNKYSSDRIVNFVKLSNIYKDAKLIYVGGKPMLNNKNLISEIEAAKLFFKNINFNLNNVVFLSESRNTIENIKSLKKFLKNNNYKNILLVTSAFHMDRVLLIAKKMDLKILPYAVSFLTNDKQHFLNIWQSLNISNNFSSFDLYFKELLGSLAVKLIL